MRSNNSEDPGTNTDEVRGSAQPRELDLDLDDFVESLGGDSVTQEDLNLIELPDTAPQNREHIPVEASAGVTCPEDSPHLAGVVQEWSARGDRLTATIKELTGWKVSVESECNRPMELPIFADEDKTYTFDEWKILISFHHMPGFALLDWSPESLEDDLKRAIEIRPESCHVQRVARHLLKHFSQDQIQELLTTLASRQP